jgi:hypothetical protein
MMGEDISPYYERVGEILEQSAALAIASAREEAYEQGRKAGVKEGCTDTAAILNPIYKKN